MATLRILHCRSSHLNLSSVVFYLNDEGVPHGFIIEGDLADPQANVLGVAMSKAEEFRKMGYRHVSISTENSMLVGKRGVDVTDETYSWKKRRP